MRGIIRTSATVALTLVAVVVTLTACADEDNPPPPPPTTSSAPPTTTQAPPPTPTLGAAAKADKAGAEAFVRYFWAVFNYTYQTGDTKLLRSISDDTCKFCTSVADDVDVLTARGDKTQGALVTLHTVVAPPADPFSGFPVYSIVSQAAGRIVGPDGVEKSASSAQPKQRSDVRIRRVGDEWRMQGVSFGGPEGQQP